MSPKDRGALLPDPLSEFDKELGLIIDGRSVPPGSTVKEAAVQGYTKLFGAGTIYGITPCTQEAAHKAVEEMQARTMALVSIAPERAPLVAAGDVNGDDDPDEESDAEGL